jgi:fructose-1,6-bisphosphatase/inositol monophosphatase family enzyme
MVKVGDEIQATKEITEENFNGQALWRHAHVGAKGHVLALLDDGEVTAYWETSSTVTDCAADEFRSLGNPDTAGASQQKGLGYA